MTRSFLSAAAGLTLACGLASAALAQGESQSPPFPERGAVFITATGAASHKILTTDEMARLMEAGATEVPAGTILAMHGGKLFLVQNHKMADGKMLSDDVMLHAAAGYH